MDKRTACFILVSAVAAVGCCLAAVFSPPGPARTEWHKPHQICIDETAYLVFENGVTPKIARDGGPVRCL